MTPATPGGVCTLDWGASGTAVAAWGPVGTHSQTSLRWMVGQTGLPPLTRGEARLCPPPSRHQNIHLQGSGGLSCKNSESQAVLGRCLICSKALVTIDSCNETVLPSPRSPPGTHQARSPDLENLRVKLHNGLRFPCSGREGAALRKARGRGQGSRSVAKHFSS